MRMKYDTVVTEMYILTSWKRVTQ